MKLLVVWILMSAVTYWFTKYSWFGKDVFQHNLKMEGSERDVITFFCIMFAAAWPLWWLLMFPVCICIGRKEPPHTNPVRNDTKHRCDSPSAEVFPSNMTKLREALKYAREVLVLNGFVEPVVRCDAALSAPARQCDVGTAEEQDKRFWQFCNEKTCKECPLKGGSCELSWGQMPYEMVQEGTDNGNK